MTQTIDLLIQNASELVTLRGPARPRVKKELQELSIIKNGSVAIHQGNILAVGKHLKYKAEETIDATGKTVLPGFVDPHTHLVFAGSREHELALKLQGVPYLEILKRGGGILYTVKQTRKASPSQLIEESTKRLDRMLSYGTTTCEAKSGYGLDTKNEKKILQVQQKLQENHPVDIVSTFLGAHAIPPDHTPEEYVTIVIDEMLPSVKNLARFCDVFCEHGVFTVQQTRRILIAAKKLGLQPKLHADEIRNTNGARLAASLNAISADHLLKSTDTGLKQMAQHNVIGVLLPGTPFSLMMQIYADARHMIHLGVPVALATDLNPNCWTENMQFIIQLACLNMNMTASEALTASTYNAACAIGQQHQIGSLEPGKKADVIILDCPSHLFLPYHVGVNLVDTVVKEGHIVHIEDKSF